MEVRSDETSLVWPWLVDEELDMFVDSCGPELEELLAKVLLWPSPSLVDDLVGQGLTRVVGVADSVCVLEK